MRALLKTRQVKLAGRSAVELELRGLRLEVLEGPDRGLVLQVSSPTVRLGTGLDNDLVLTDGAVSRHHAEVELTDEGARVLDRASTNGTYVNGVRVPEAEFQGEVELRLGGSRLSVREGSETRHALPGDEDRLGPLVGRSSSMRDLYGLLRALATSGASVLVQGESGTGKELVAQAIHELSRRTGPLVVFDAAASDPQMIRGDLFGHVRGAYTGAERERAGAFRSAHCGTLFLDELGELPLDLQPRLLRALESRRVTPMGSDTPVDVDVRVVAATHRDLEAMVREGSFRGDLYHRLAVVPLRVPPLRERPEDVPLLVAHLAAQLELRCTLSPDAVEAMARHPWPGNVRELRNFLERLSATRPGAVLSAGELPLPAVPAEPEPTGRSESDRSRIEEVLRRNRGNKAAAARELGISLSTLKRRLRRWAEETDGEP